MIKNILGAGLIACMLMLNSCADDDLSPILTFDAAAKGAYPRLLDETDKLLNLFDIEGSAYTYNVEFVTVPENPVAEYVITVEYNDEGEREFRSFSASDFSTNERGLQQAPTITITGPEALAAVSKTEDQIEPGDQIRFRGTVILENGFSFTATNSSSTVKGAAFRGHFDYTMTAGCPSDPTVFVGTYNYRGFDFWCGNDPVEGTVEVVDLGKGFYGFNDWTFGGYGSCYSGFDPASWGELSLQDVCKVLSLSGRTDNYGETWTVTGKVEGSVWTLEWSNTYEGEAGKAEITTQDGSDFPFQFGK